MSQSHPTYAIRAIAAADNAAVARIIRTVMPEFGASGPGFSINDPEVNTMFEAYSAARSAFYVVTLGDAIVGCGGVAPLAMGSDEMCELRKMYFMPEARGLGAGRALLVRCLDAARGFGFTYCYLETLGSMRAAHRLYEAAGFERLAGPIGSTGHFKCDAFYGLALTPT